MLPMLCLFYPPPLRGSVYSACNVFACSDFTPWQRSVLAFLTTRFDPEVSPFSIALALTRRHFTAL